jgi:hypothetical protein
MKSGSRCSSTHIAVPSAVMYAMTSTRPDLRVSSVGVFLRTLACNTLLD